MKLSVGYNMNAKQYEAFEVGAGRPLKEHTKENKSRRNIFIGATRAECIQNAIAGLRAKKQELVAA